VLPEHLTVIAVRLRPHLAGNVLCLFRPDIGHGHDPGHWEFSEEPDILVAQDAKTDHTYTECWFHYLIFLLNRPHRLPQPVVRRLCARGTGRFLPDSFKQV
jgi:hypothetical protein